jgi:hypothetical protein
MTDDTVARWRDEVRRAHELVPRGRYDEAITRFEAALVALRERLGAAHPEVEELVDDLDAARSMRDVAQWSREMGFRTPGVVPKADDGDV